MPTLFTQDDNRLDMDQTLTLHTVTSLPTISVSQKGDMLFNDAGGITEHAVYFNGNDWVELGWGFIKEAGIVAGTDHLVRRGPSAFGFESRIDITPFATAIQRNDGSGHLIIGGEDAPGKSANLLWGRPQEDGIRWNISMQGQDSGGPSGYGGADLHYVYTDNEGNNGKSVMKMTREDDGRVEMRTNFRIPVYSDLINFGPVVPVEGDVAYDQLTEKAYVWTNTSGWMPMN